MVVQHRFPLLLRKLDPETSISTPVPTRLFHRGSDYSHPRNLYSHARNPYSHPPGIFIHIAPESVFTCPGIRILSTLADNGRVFPGKIGTSVHPSRSDLYYVAITSEELCRLLSCCVRYNACATLPESVVDYRISMRRAKRAFTSRVADCSSKNRSLRRFVSLHF